jgi:hypothetical protein
MNFKPSLCRMVIAIVDPANNNGADVAPAVITRVWGQQPDGAWTVNVQVFNDSPVSEWKTSIVLFDTEEQAREHGTHAAFWPPRS